MPGRQQGGTLAGLIVGLIIGLLVAVGVAMTIMKTPLPFVDKLGKQAQPAGELGDPNKTLPGGARERRERVDVHVGRGPDAPAVRVGRVGVVLRQDEAERLGARGHLGDAVGSFK